MGANGSAHQRTSVVKPRDPEKIPATNHFDINLRDNAGQTMRATSSRNISFLRDAMRRVPTIDLVFPYPWNDTRWSVYHDEDVPRILT